MSSSKLPIHTAGRHLLDRASGVVMSDPDQNVKYLGLIVMSPAMAGMIPIWEPFPHDQNLGHNLAGFQERWDDWLASDRSHLETVEPRFGHPQLLQRSIIPFTACVRIESLAPEQVRAPARLRALPVQLGPDGQLLDLNGKPVVISPPG